MLLVMLGAAPAVCGSAVGQEKISNRSRIEYHINVRQVDPAIISS